MLIHTIQKDYLTLLRNRFLIHFMVGAQRRSETARTLLSGAWEVLEPLSQMLIYYFLVVVVVRSGGSNAVTMLLTGIVHYSFLSSTLISSFNAINRNRLLMLQVTMEPLVLIATSFYRSLWNFGIALALYWLFYLIAGPPLETRTLLYPVILLVLLTSSWAGSIILGTLVVFYLDLKPLTTVVLRVAMYLSPVVYLVTYVPEPLRQYYLYNPLACTFALLQWCLLGVPAPSAGPVIVLVASALALLLCAHQIYRTQKVHLTKVL